MNTFLGLILTLSFPFGAFANSAFQKWENGDKYQLIKVANERIDDKCIPSFVLQIGVRAGGDISGPIGKTPGAADHIFFIDVSDSQKVLKNFDLGYSEEEVTSGMLSGTITQTTIFDESGITRISQSDWYPKERCKDQCNSKTTESVKYDGNSNLVYRLEKMSCTYKRF